tara:strand:+ start:3493 stop:3684 length:192 start_codon:yes stop_codon:yes gene_type:complete
MKIKINKNSFHRINPNGVKCDKVSLNKLRDGEAVELTEEVASELLNMGFVEPIKSKKKKKESK